MGDQRINPFGMGGEIEIRSGLLTQKQSISRQFCTSGWAIMPGRIRSHRMAERVHPGGIWAKSGTVRAGAAAAEGIVSVPLHVGRAANAVLKGRGSDVCTTRRPPGWRFARADQQTQQWFKISGDQLAPRDGYYDLRLTNEYWETYYIDSLLAAWPSIIRKTLRSTLTSAWRSSAPLKFYVTAKPKTIRQREGRYRA